MSPRPDAPYVRAWLQRDPLALPQVRLWQRLPFIEVVPEIWREFLRRREEPCFDAPLPFDDFLLWMAQDPAEMDVIRATAQEMEGLTHLDGMECFARVSNTPDSLAAYNEVPHSDRSRPHDGQMICQLYIAIQAIVHNRMIGMRHAIGFIVRDATGHAVFSDVSTNTADPLDKQQVLGNAFGALASWVGYTLEYLTTVGHAVEERAPAPLDPKVRAKADKTARQCPWLREDLPVIRLMTPATAAARYGQRRPETPSGRQSPRAHARRGHRRRYRDDQGAVIKVVNVRPAWIGPEAWEHAGRHYRLLGL